MPVVGQVLDAEADAVRTRSACSLACAGQQDGGSTNSSPDTRDVDLAMRSEHVEHGADRGSAARHHVPMSNSMAAGERLFSGAIEPCSHSVSW